MQWIAIIWVESYEEAKREAAATSFDFDETEVDWNADDDAQDMEVDAA